MASALYFSRLPIPYCGARSLSTQAQVEAGLRHRVPPRCAARVCRAAAGAPWRNRIGGHAAIPRERSAVRMVPTRRLTHAVDTPGDLELVASLMARYPWSMRHERQSDMARWKVLVTRAAGHARRSGAIAAELGAAGCDVIVRTAGRAARRGRAAAARRRRSTPSSAATTGSPVACSTPRRSCE